MIAIVSNMKSNGLSVTSSSSLSKMGNLVCGISSTDMSSITTTTFKYVYVMYKKKNNFENFF
jgi:hypothetical protein